MDVNCNLTGWHRHTVHLHGGYSRIVLFLFLLFEVYYTQTFILYFFLTTQHQPLTVLYNYLCTLCIAKLAQCTVAVYICGPQPQKSTYVFRHFGDILACKFSHGDKCDFLYKQKTREPCVF